MTNITHKHHLKPKHLGGTDDPENLLEVTVEEHALIHEARWYAYRHWEDWLAWKGLTKTLGREEIIYEICKNAAKGSKRTEEHKKIISQTHKGKFVSNETRQKISKSRKERGSEKPEANLKRSQTLKGRPQPWMQNLTMDIPRVAKCVTAMNTAVRGKKQSPEHIQKRITSRIATVKRKKENVRT